MIVVDAGVWVRGLIDDGPQGEASRTVLTSDLGWIAPGHAPIGVLRTIRRYESSGLLTTVDADAFAAEVCGAAVTYVGPEPWLLRPVWQHRRNVSPSNGFYVGQ